MDRQTYLKRFSFAAGWYLSAAEAGDVIADYTEMLLDRSDDTALSETMGKPRQAAKLLTEKKSYRRWLVAFAAMSFCLLLPQLLLLTGRFHRHRHPIWLMMLLLLAGIAVAFLRFRPRTKAARTSLPKKLLPALAVLLVVCGLAALVLMGLVNGYWETIGPGRYGTIARRTLFLCRTASIVAAFVGLILARTTDRRWRALYLAGLTATIISVIVTATITGMSLDLASTAFLRDYLVGLSREVVGISIFALVGFTAAGVSLC